MTMEQTNTPVVCDGTIAAHVANAAHGARYGIDWIWHHDGIGYLYASHHAPAAHADTTEAPVDAKALLEALISRLEVSAQRGAPVRPERVAESLREVVAAMPAPVPGQDWREAERLRLLELRHLLEGFEVCREVSPLQSPATHLDKITLSCEFQPGAGAEAALHRLTAILAAPVRHPPEPDPAFVAPDTFWVMDVPGWPGGYAVHPNTLDYALSFIREHGNAQSSLSTWRSQYQRRDYTPEQVQAMINSAGVSGNG